MSASDESLLSSEEECGLHERLLAGDVTASATLFSKLLDPLIGWLIAKNSSAVPEDFCIEAAEDSVIALAKSPSSFKAARGMRLFPYLCMSAQGDLRNILRRERRHLHVSLESVALSTEAGKYLIVKDDALERLEVQEEAARITEEVVTVVRDGLTEGESRMLDLLLQGEKKTAVFAQALGITDLEKTAQQRKVKRVRDKLQKRIKRETSGDGRVS
jgi:hypothetical protein